MQSFLSSLETIITKKAKRRGRGIGSGRGSKSGRGTTRHQKARESIPLHFEGGQGRLVKRFPLLRGKSKNKSVGNKNIALSSSIINFFNDGDILDFDKLVECSYLRNSDRHKKVKFVLDEIVTKKCIVKLAVTKGVRQSIESCGGSIE